MKTREHQVIMLPTDKASKLGFAGNSLSFTNSEGLKTFFYIPQHLYFISDEPIKERDWYCSPSGAILSQHNGSELLPDGWKKVIATTNPDLWKKTTNNHGFNFERDYGDGIPKIDTTFIEVYCREQGKIDKVLLEYESEFEYEGFAGKSYSYNLKLKPNGSVIVHPVKEKMYSKEEVIKHLEEFTFLFAGEHHRLEAPGYVEFHVKDYIEQNL